MLIIKNCDISTGSENETKNVDIYIEDGKIIKIDTHSPNAPTYQQTNAPTLRLRSGQANQIIDASHLLAIPGAIDPHVHFDTPGFEAHEDFAHGTRGAAAGGVTTVIDMPDTSIPPVTSRENLWKKLKVIQPMAHVDFALWGGVSQNVFREEGGFDLKMIELWDAGVVGFKAYLLSGMDTFRALSFIELGQVMQKAKDIGALVGLHAEDPEIVNKRMSDLKAANRRTIYDYYLARSEPAEKNGVIYGLGLAKQTRARLHIVHLASGAAVQLLEWTKAAGLGVSAETCPHYLTFTCDDFEKYGSLIKTAPVIKTAADRAALWQGLIEGSIDFLATDHAPCPIKDKSTGNAWTDYAGMPGVELLLPFAFSEGYLKDRLTLERLIEVTSTAAAKRFGLYPTKGAIEVGSDADIVLINPKGHKKIDGKKLESKAKWTPFDGTTFDGEITRVMVRGNTVYTKEDGVTGKAGIGKWIKREERSLGYV